MLSQHLDRSSNVHIHANRLPPHSWELAVAVAVAALLFKCCAIYLYAKQYGNWSLDFRNRCFPFAQIRYVLLFDCARGGSASFFFCFFFFVAVVTDFSWQRKIWCDVLISKKNTHTESVPVQRNSSINYAHLKIGADWYRSVYLLYTLTMILSRSRESEAHRLPMLFTLFYFLFIHLPKSIFLSGA